MYGKTLLTAVAFVAFAGGALPAQAASDPGKVSVTVGLGGLNLGNEPGAGAALRRIHNAAQSICGGTPDIRDLDGAAAYRDCMAATMAPAVASLNSPIVTALYAGRDPRAAGLLTAAPAAGGGTPSATFR